jgi:beta-galactosidase
MALSNVWVHPISNCLTITGFFYHFGLQADGSRVAEAASMEMTGYNDDNWKKIALPHDWAIEGPFRIDLPGESGKLPYKGIGCYRKYFDVPLYDKGKQFFLDFDGAMANAQVWVNGNYAGGWPYGYTSFRIDLTPFLRYGQKNLVAVKLNTEKWDARWYSGAGIYRHVWLVKTNVVHVAHWGAFITTPEVSKEMATIKLDVTLDNQGKLNEEVVVKTEVFELDINNKLKSKVATTDEKMVVINTGKTITLSFQTIISNPKLWDVVSPNRYMAQTTVKVKCVVVDTYNTPFGVRTIKFTHDNGFLLNGKRGQIQGVCNHHDLGALGAAINTSALRRQLTILKEMGCNAIRTSHNPPAPELLELADKMGFLIMDEAFDCWRHGKKRMIILSSLRNGMSAIWQH